MKTIKQWQEEFSNAATKKYPINNKWSHQDRTLSILRQLADVSRGIQWEQNLYSMSEEGLKHFKSTNHRIAALLADILILCEERKFDSENELVEVLNWYRGG